MTSSPNFSCAQCETCIVERLSRFLFASLRIDIKFRCCSLAVCLVFETRAACQQFIATFQKYSSLSAVECISCAGNSAKNEVRPSKSKEAQEARQMLQKPRVSLSTITCGRTFPTITNTCSQSTQEIASSTSSTRAMELRSVLSRLAVQAAPCATAWFAWKLCRDNL